MKQLLFILFFLPIIGIGMAESVDESNSQDLSGYAKERTHYIAIDPDSVAPDENGMRNLTSVELAKEMVPGWNVGNSLDAIGGETAWGNPEINEELIEAVKDAGFNAVRIPIAWSNSMDMTTFTIDEELMIRVEEVVDYVLDTGMYAIINIHWDNGWMQPTYEQQDYVNNRLAVIWQQIAVYFRDYDDHLLFAGTNEVMVEGDYGTPKKEYYTVQNSFNQTFVNTVRSTGGCNYYRHLIVQGFNTNINYTVSFFTIPQDVVENRLMVEVHYYDPYNFTINENTTITQWGMNATDPSKTETWANESYADAQFQKMKTSFVDQGYAVILGEYGAIARLNLGSDELNEEHAEFRRYYIEYITESICKHGLVPFYWDAGYAGDHSMGLFNRETGEQVYEEIIEAIMEAVEAANITTGLKIRSYEKNPTTFSLGQNYPNPFNPSTRISFEIPSQSFVSLKVFNLAGREVTTLVSEELEAGRHTQTWNASGFTSGVYICKLQAGDFRESKKLIMQK